MGYKLTTSSYKNLIISQSGKDNNDNLKHLLGKLKNKKFYCNKPFKSIKEYCCIWHTLPPLKPSDDKPSELYPWQQGVIADLEKFRRLASVKCRSAGLSELAIMKALHVTLSEQKSGNVFFISGVGYSHIRDLARRTREKFAAHEIFFDLDNNITLTFPNTRWEFFGSDSRSWRGRTNCVYLVCDELTTFNENELPLAAINTYTHKHPNALVWLITTPSYNTNSFAFKLFNEVDDNKVLYHRNYISYKVCLGNMLDPAAIELQQRTNPYFPIEYDLKWGYSVQGSCFSPESIEAAITKPKYIMNPMADKILGIDIGFGSSATSYCVIQLNDSLIQVLHSSQLEKSDFNDAIYYGLELIRKYSPHHVYLDAAAPSFIRALKTEMQEDPEYERAMDLYHKLKVPFENNMVCCPVNFGTKHKDLLAFCKLAMDRQLVAIDETINPKLIADLRVVTEINGKVNKSVNTLDIFDSWRLAMYGVKF